MPSSRVRDSTRASAHAYLYVRVASTSRLSDLTEVRTEVRQLRARVCGGGGLTVVTGVDKELCGPECEDSPRLRAAAWPSSALRLRPAYQSARRALNEIKKGKC